MKFSLSLILILLIKLTIANSNIRFENGVLDIRGKNINDIGIIDFTGEWEFYWNRLLTPNDFNNVNHDFLIYIKVPGNWSSVTINNKKLPPHGAATYRAIILKDTGYIDFGIRIGGIGTAYKLFIDGKEKIKAGIVSTNKTKAISGYKADVVNFTSTNDTIELIIQVSNYNYAKAGIWNNFNKIGSHDKINKVWTRNMQISILIIGIMLIISFYHLSFYYLNKNFVFALFFGLFCIIIIIRTLIVDEILLLDFFPSFNWINLIKVEYLNLSVGSLLFILFIYYYFKDNYAKWLFYTIVIFDIIFSVLILITQPDIFTKYLKINQLLIVLSLIYSSILVVRALKNGTKSAGFMALGFLILMTTVINDILYVNKAIDTIYLSSFGFVIFIISQSFMMSKHSSNLFKETQDLASKLKLANINLENIVEERTSKIKEQRDKFFEQHRIVEEQKKQITSSIQYAGRIQDAVLNTANEIDSIAPKNFIIYHPKDIVSGDFYWSKQVVVGGKTIKLVAVVDCTGHGVPGAFMSILGSLLLNNIINDLKQIPKASDILLLLKDEVVKLLYNTNKNHFVNDGMDMSLIIIDYDNMNIQFSGAHSSIFIVPIEQSDNKNIIEYKGDNISIGYNYNSKKVFTNHTIKINKDDIIYMFSDGYYDQFGGVNNKRMQKKEFKRILLSISNHTLKEQRMILERKLLEWRGNTEQIDDITVLGFRI